MANRKAATKASIPRTKYSRTLGPTAGLKAASARQSLRDPNATMSTKQHASHTLTVLSRKVAARQARRSSK